MRNPFEVLGLNPGASDDEVRSAYRALAREFSEGDGVSQRRMKEIDEAYDAIILNRTGNGGGGYAQQQQQTYAQPDYSQQSYTAGNDLGDIRAKINSGRIDDADMLLDGVPMTMRTAEWYYLKGTVQHRKGWLEEAAKNFGTASRMEPNNAEYSRASSSINSDRSGGYRTEQKNSKSSSCSACDVCSGLLCADCCCESMGGDLIPCC